MVFGLTFPVKLQKYPSHVVKMWVRRALGFFLLSVFCFHVSNPEHIFFSSEITKMKPCWHRESLLRCSATRVLLRCSAEVEVAEAGPSGMAAGSEVRECACAVPEEFASQPGTCPSEW